MGSAIGKSAASLALVEGLNPAIYTRRNKQPLPAPSPKCHHMQGKAAMTPKHLRRRAVEEITGLSRSTIYDLMAKGQFPRPVKLTGRAVAWPESKIADWLASRAAA